MAHPQPALSGEKPSTFLQGLFSWIGEYSKLRQFLSTRSAVKSGEKIFDLSSEDLTKRKLMGGISFNVYQSVLSAAPGAAIAYAIGVLIPKNNSSVTISSNANEFTKGVAFRDTKCGARDQSFCSAILGTTFTLIYCVGLCTWLPTWEGFNIDSAGSKPQCFSVL